jgi:hypothetical protein
MIRGLAAIVLVSGALAGNIHAQKIERGIRLNADGAVRVYGGAGVVRVIGWNRDSLAVRGSLGEGNSLHFGGTAGGAKMFIEARDERNPAPAVLEIMVPSRAKVWVKTVSADIEVSSVTGSLDLYVVGGKISVRGNPADVNAEAIDGPITIVGSPGWLRAKSASGDVTLNGSSADAALSTVSGKIVAEGAGFEKARFESVTGSIQFAGGFRPGGLASFDTHSGTIEIGLSSRTPADFDVVSIAGPITNSLTGSKPMKGRYGRGSELSTSNAGGGTRIAVRSFKGQISLRRLD